MRTFAQEQNQPQKAASSSLARSKMATPRSAHCEHPLLHLQRVIGNQAVQRMLQTHTEGLTAGSTGTASPHFGHDSGQIPIHPSAAGVIQTKLAVNWPGDDCEQEADHVSQQVMPEPQLQRACPCGGNCPKCQTKHTGREHERPQSEGVQASNTGQIAAPTIVHEVLRAPGQPLDPATRGFMESRFGHDFSRVRVHADATTAESARAVNARAYTVGHDLVFGAGQYAPETSEGRRLVAHELTHVVQQTTASNQRRSAEFASSSVGSNVLQRKPDKPTQAEGRREQQLEELARDPGAAHQAWKKLSPAEQIAVVERMRRRYGQSFAQQFLDEVKKGKPQVVLYYYPPESGPKPDQLIASGYRFAEMEITGTGAIDVEVWVHPSGKKIRRDVSTYKFGAPEPKKGPETKVKEPKTKVKEPETKPPPEDPRIWEALKLLEELERRNNELQDLCISGPFHLEKAEEAQINWTFSREKLKEFKRVNMSAVYPDFWNAVAAATAENVDLRVACCKRDPSNFFFSCDELKSK
jgi:hypothetical protein